MLLKKSYESRTMRTTYQYFKSLGCKELPYSQLPNGYAWVSGCGGDGWYWNFFMKVDEMGDTTDEGYKKVIMCKIERL